jgi:hypothetical protein
MLAWDTSASITLDFFAPIMTRHLLRHLDAFPGFSHFTSTIPEEK